VSDPEMTEALLADINQRLTDKTMLDAQDLHQALISVGAQESDGERIKAVLKLGASNWNGLQANEVWEGYLTAHLDALGGQGAGLDANLELKVRSLVLEATKSLDNKTSPREVAKKMQERLSAENLVAESPEGTPNLLAATKWPDVEREIREKPPAHVTSYLLDVPGIDSDKTDDRYLRLQTGALSIVAGPTGQGKTAMIISLMVDAVRQEGSESRPRRRHWFFTFEESRSAIHIRVLSAFVGCTLSRNNKRAIESYFKGHPKFITDDQGDSFSERLREYQQLVNDGFINVVDAGNHTVEQLLADIREISRDNPGLVFVDYIQLLFRGEGGFSSRAEELKITCNELKNVAVETRLSLVAAAQFNREVTSPDKMKVQSIADASDIEKSANKVIAIWNGNFAPRDKEGKEKPKHEEKPDTLYVEVMKARDERSGGTGRFLFDGNIGFVRTQHYEPTKPPRAFADDTPAKSTMKKPEKF